MDKQKDQNQEKKKSAEEAEKKQKESPAKQQEEPAQEDPFDFGGLPKRNLKKNLGCG